MRLPKIATRDEWMAGRKDLLAKEKELTRRLDTLSVERRNLPGRISPVGDTRLRDLTVNRPTPRWGGNVTAGRAGRS